MDQTRLGSLIEAITNIFIGFGINFTANALIFPLFGWSISASQNLSLGLIYTAISIARSYTIRRFFNSYVHRLSSRLASMISKKSEVNFE